MTLKKLSRQERGFTIIELMIATSVLSIILLLVSTMMIKIGNLYQKGINQSKVQGTARTVVSDVTADLQLSGKPAPLVNDPTNPALHAYCIGESRYTFVVGKMLGNAGDTDTDGSAKSPKVLWKDKTPDTGCSTTSLDPDGTEMMPANSRLLGFSILGTSPYEVSIGIAYGDIDLLNTDVHPLDMTTNCKGSIGDQFCATAKLTTTAANRLQ